MKMVLIIHDAVFEHEVAEAVERAGCPSWSKLERVLGRGEATGPRLDTAVWPGFNQGILVAADPEKAATLLDELRRLRDSGRVRGLRAFAWEAVQEL